MNFVLVTRDAEIAQAAANAYGTHYGLKVFETWNPALSQLEGVDLMFVDLVATLDEPGKIEGYERFAAAKMAHETGAKVPLVVIAPPTDSEVDAMVGWPNFVFAMVRRPVTEKLFRQASGWV